MTHSDETVESIHAFNMALLRLVQTMAKEDIDRAAQCLGVAPAVVKMMAQAPDARLAELAAIPQLLCAFRFESESVLSILAPAERTAVSASASVSASVSASASSSATSTQ